MQTNNFHKLNIRNFTDIINLWLLNKLSQFRVLVSLILISYIVFFFTGNACLLLGLFFNTKGMEEQNWNKSFEYNADLGNKECNFEFSMLQLTIEKFAII